MDNTNEIGIKETDAAWLAGVFDMAGSIGIIFVTGRTGRKYVTKRFQYCPQMSFTITQNEVTRTKVSTIVEGEKIKAYWHITPRKGNIDPEMQLVVRNWRGVQKLCQLLLPYAVTKKQHFQTFLGFAEKYLKGRHVKILGREWDEANLMFRRKVDWSAVEEFIDMVETLRAMSTKRGKYNLKWTPEKIRQTFREVDGELFPSSFIGMNR